MILSGAAARRSVIGVVVVMQVAVSALLSSGPAAAQGPPQVLWQSEDRLWWNTPWLDWVVVDGTTGICSIDGGDPFECRSPFELNRRLQVANEGLHEAMVTPVDDGVDPAVRGEPVTVQVGVDRTPPKLTLTRSDLRNRVRVGDPMAVRASHEDAVSGVVGLSCTILPGDVYAEGDIDCSESLDDGVVELGHLPEGGYELRAIATDRAGNTSLHEQSSWIVDGSAPNAAMHRGHPQLVLRSATPLLHFSGNEYGPDAVSSSTFTMRSRIGTRRSGPDRVRWQLPETWAASGTGEIPRFGRRIRAMVPGTTYCVETEAADEVGNRQPWSFRRCLVRAQDDTALSTSRGWQATSPQGAHRQTASTSSSRDRRAWVRGEKVYAVHLRALRCSRCGSLVVRAGGREVGRWNLRAPSRRWAVRSFRLGGAFTGRVTVATTSGRKVVLDAFGLRAMR